MHLLILTMNCPIHNFKYISYVGQNSILLNIHKICFLLFYQTALLKFVNIFTFLLHYLLVSVTFPVLLWLLEIHPHLALNFWKSKWFINLFHYLFMNFTCSFFHSFIYILNFTFNQEKLFSSQSRLHCS